MICRTSSGGSEEKDIFEGRERPVAAMRGRCGVYCRCERSACISCGSLEGAEVEIRMKEERAR